MTIQNFMAEQIERIGLALAEFIGTTDPSRLSWQPEIPGGAPTRSVLEQIGECIAVNRRFAALLRGEEVPPQPGGATGTVPASPEEAQADIITSAEELAAAVRALKDAGLDKIY